jgi:hypothetical protein
MFEKDGETGFPVFPVFIVARRCATRRITFLMFSGFSAHFRKQTRVTTLVSDTLSTFFGTPIFVVALQLLGAELIISSSTASA